MNSLLIENKYEIITKIGEGGFGVTYKAREIGTSNIVTIKQIKKKKWSSDEEIPQTILQEIEILKDLRDCSSIINLKDVILDRSSKNVFLIYEYHEHDFNNLIYRRKSMTVQQIKSYMKQMIIALQTVHSKGYIHCDVKPGNFIISSENEVKIIDFGVSQKIATQYKFPRMGTNIYNAPELILGGTEYGIEVDIWALGCTFYEMMTKEQLFHHCYSDAAIANQMIQIFNYPNKNDYHQFSSLPNSDLFFNCLRYSNLSVNEFFDIKLPKKFKFMKKLLIKMLQLNPKNRISLEDALNDSVFVDTELPEKLPMISFAEHCYIKFAKCNQCSKAINKDIFEDLRPNRIVPSSFF